MPNANRDATGETTDRILDSADAGVAVLWRDSPDRETLAHGLDMLARLLVGVLTIRLKHDPAGAQAIQEHGSTAQGKPLY